MQANNQPEAEAAERLAGARVVTDEIAEVIADLDYWGERLADVGQPQGSSALKHAAHFLRALAEPAGEVEPSKWSIPGSSYAGASTPPDASAIRGALEALPRRQEKISGQTFSYIKLEDAIAVIGDGGKDA